MLNGVFAINDVVARKTFGAGPALIVLLTMAPSASQLLALFLAPSIRRSDLRRFFFLSGLVGRLVLVGMAWVTDARAFLVLVLMNSIVQTAVLPVQNAVYQANYRPMLRGRLFGWASTLTGLTTVIASLAAGSLLEGDPRRYRFIYPAAGVAGFLGMWIFGLIRLRRRGAGGLPRELHTAQDLAPRSMGVLRQVRTLFAADRGFFHFEMTFMLYGLAYMAIQPCLAPFLVDVMRLDYRQASFAKGAIFHVAVVLATPIAGVLHDRIGMERLGVLAFAMLSAFTASLSLATGRHAVFAGFALYGAAMACVGVVWTMGPIKFAGTRDATPYMGVHVAMVGIRGMVGHPLGGLVAAAFGTPRATFVLSSILFAVATATMARRARALSREPDSA